MNISVVNYSHGPVNINHALWTIANNFNENIATRTSMRYSVESDYVGIQMDLDVLSEETPVITLGFLVGFHIDGWKQMIDDGFNPEKNREALFDLCRLFWNVATGVVAVSTTTENHPGLILPSIDVAKFVEKISIVRS